MREHGHGPVADRDPQGSLEREHVAEQAKGQQRAEQDLLNVGDAARSAISCPIVALVSGSSSGSRITKGSTSMSFLR